MHALLESDTGRAELERIARPRLLCAFDFDGTLAPLVSHPDDARLGADMRERLLVLQQVAPVAIITGRALEDVQPRLGFEADFVVGNHGLEGVPGVRAASRGELHRALVRNWRAQLEVLLAAEYPDPGVQIEDKRYSLSLHYRHAAAAERAQEDLEPLLTSLDPPPRVVGGKCVFNLLPGDAGHKGTALEHLLEETGAASALYAGDDITDEDVFRLRRSDLLSVRVEPASFTAAPFYVRDIAAMAALIDWLARHLREQGAQNWVRGGTRAASA